MRQGFSLVELSIVLVILGLLTGGILTGQNLIRAAELRSVTTQASQYTTAVYTFRDKYFYLPGDMPNATDFWGAMSSGTCPNATGGTGTQTCNGNGDGIIRDFGSATDSQSSENFTFWQQLANAQLIEGNYTGIAGGGDSIHAVIGENVPAAKISNGGWSVYQWISGASDFFPVATGRNTLVIGGPKPDTITSSPIFTPEEHWNLDTKLDDGKPGTGKITGRDSTLVEGSDCVDGSDPSTAAYNLDLDDVVCTIYIGVDF